MIRIFLVKLAKKVEQGFEYNSGNNEEWLSKDELLRLVEMI